MLGTHHKLANPLKDYLSEATSNHIPNNLIRYHNQQWHKQHANEPFNKNISNSAKLQIENFTKSCSESICKQINSSFKTRHPDIKQHYESINELIQLKRANKIIIKKSDKSSKLTIMDKHDYTLKALNHLNDPLSYELKYQSNNLNSSIQADSDQMNHFKIKIADQVINSFNQHIRKPLLNSQMINKKQLLHYISPNQYSMKFPRIYFLPKTHKPGSPFRPIVSTINWLTENASILLDSVLQQELFATGRHQQLPRDTFSFLHALCNAKLNLKQQRNAYLVTFDIASLYTSIPQQLASQRAYELLKSSERPQSFAPRFIYNISQWILKNNFFQFQDRIYHQKHGIAMGNVAGGALANTYLIQWESTFLKDPQLANQLQFYQRYFDDGFFIWTGEEQLLYNFLDRLNNIDHHIKITHHISIDTIQYLDIEITFNQFTCNSCTQMDPATCNNFLCKSTSPFLTRTHRKAIATDSYLNFKSAHPYHLRVNLPHSILFRTFLISSNLSTYLRARQQIFDFFVNSDYPLRTISNSFAKFESKHGLASITNINCSATSFWESQHRFHLIRVQILEKTCRFKASSDQKPINDPDPLIFLPITFYPNINYNVLFNKSKFKEHLNKTKIVNHRPITSFRKPNSLLKFLSKASD